jgi:hypothetical protein
MNKIRPIAFYLPQYHPIPENDRWWGKGFTEWTNVTKAKPLFKGHKQPHYPADLGYYDLRVPEIREQQAELARKAGIEGFCYWHYWFGNGKRLLERPFNEVLQTGKPDFPFCLGWANESWSGIWHGAKDKVLINQEYPGVKDYEDHFNALLPAFLDKRYIRVDNKPLFLIYNPTELPDMNKFCELFNTLALKNNLNGIHFVANNIKNNNIDWNPEMFGFDAYTTSSHNGIIHQRGSQVSKNIIKNKFLRRLHSKSSMPLYTYKYEEALNYFLYENKLKIDSYPTIIAGWDNSPRCGINALILTDFTPELFRIHLKQVFPLVEKTINKVVFVKSWNEWAEGNYLEPESEYGTQFLDIFRDEIRNFKNTNLKFIENSSLA